MRGLAFILAVLAIVSMIGCGGSGSSHPATVSSSTSNSVTINTTVSTATVLVGATQTFAAIVTGTSNTAVTWSVPEVGVGGTVDANGKYTAPNIVGTFHVVATSVADPSKSATITVAVITFGIDPPSASLAAGGTQQFYAGPISTLSFSILEGSAGGTVTSGGLYTAPAVAGTYHVVATLNANPSITATATITVVGAITISPATISLNRGASQQFSVQVTGIPNPASFTWSVVEAPFFNAGTISSSGLFTASQVAGTIHVKVASTATPALNATAAVTVTGQSAYFTLQPGAFPPDSTIADVGRVGVTALADGSVLATGGQRDAPGGCALSGSCVSTSRSAFRYVVAADGTVTASSVGSMNAARSGHTSTLLRDGRVLLVGGDGGTGQTTSEVYDPRTNTFIPTGVFTFPVATSGIFLAPVTLPDGTVLVVEPRYGGEIYDPASGTFGPLIPISGVGVNAMIAPLLDGRVLIAGGCINCTVPVPGAHATANAVIFDPATRQFSPTGSMTGPRDGGTAVTRADGPVLILSGRSDVFSPAYLSSAELYDPRTGTFSAIGNMNAPDGPIPAAVRLANGTVLVIPSSNFVIATPAYQSAQLGYYPAEIYDPQTRSFTPTALTGLPGNAGLHAVLLPSGLVFASRGFPDSPIAIYHP